MHSVRICNVCRRRYFSRLYHRQISERANNWRCSATKTATWRKKDVPRNCFMIVEQALAVYEEVGDEGS